MDRDSDDPNDAWLSELSKKADHIARRDEAARATERAEKNRQQKLLAGWKRVCEGALLPEFNRVQEEFSKRPGLSTEVASGARQVKLMIRSKARSLITLTVGIEIDRDSRAAPVRVSGIPVPEGLSGELRRETHYITLDRLESAFVRTMIQEFLEFVGSDQSV